MKSCLVLLYFEFKHFSIDFCKILPRSLASVALASVVNFVGVKSISICFFCLQSTQRLLFKPFLLAKALAVLS